MGPLKSKAAFLVVVSGIIVLILIWKLLNVLILALLFSSLLNKSFIRFSRQLKSKTLALISTLMFTTFLILIPLSIFTAAIATEASYLKSDFEAFSLSIPTQKILIDSINAEIESIPYINTSQLRLKPTAFQTLLRSSATKLDYSAIFRFGQDIGLFFAQCVIFLLLLIYLLPEHQKLIQITKQLSPLTNATDEIFLSRISAMVRGILKGQVIISVVVAAIAGTTLWILGVKYFLLWSLLIIIASLLPLGPAIITMPISLFLFVTGQSSSGLILLVITVLVLMQIDNILRPRLVSKTAHLHPALLLLGVIGGINWFGILGLIYGPVIMIILTTSVELYTKQGVFEN